MLEIFKKPQSNKKRENFIGENRVKLFPIVRSHIIANIFAARNLLMPAKLIPRKSVWINRKFAISLSQNVNRICISARTHL